MLFALIDATDTVIRYSEADAAPPTLAPEKGLRWAPVTDIRPAPQDGEVLSGPQLTVTAAGLTRTWTVIPAPVPQRVTMRQARLALLAAGLLNDVKMAVAAVDDPEIEIEWEYATEIQREAGLVGRIADHLKLSGSRIDDLFRAASRL